MNVPEPKSKQVDRLGGFTLRPCVQDYANCSDRLGTSGKPAKGEEVLVSNQEWVQLFIPAMTK